MLWVNTYVDSGRKPHRSTLTSRKLNITREKSKAQSTTSV